MPQTFFTSDTHFGHANVIRYAHRPFRDREEMDAAMVRNWNAVVKPGDRIYHLGDFSFARPPRTAEILDLLQGEIHLVRGNHDKGLTPALEKRFAWVKDCYTLKVEDPEADGGVQRIVLFHYAMRVWDQSHRGAWHLYGHSHGSLPDDPASRSFDIGVDCHGFAPVPYARVKEIIAAKRWEPVDHHGRARDEEE
jgi:calcineurin-like phosphoesterase family protein